MGGASTLVAFSAGVVLGVFITQNYKIPDVKQGVDWLSQQTAKIEKVYKKPKE